MDQPYLLISDLHCHCYSQFGSPGSDGVNTRLRILLDEVERSVGELKAAGGHEVVLAGDLFHTRGSIDPEVFNPTYDLFQSLCRRGFQIYAIPGNHDLKSKDTTVLSNAIQSLGHLDNFDVITAPAMRMQGKVVFLPWRASLDDLRRDRDTLFDAYCDLDAADLVMHAGIDDVLPGLPDHGLDPAEVADWGFRRVFAGHYHHHKVMEGGKVVSIGATTQHQWTDVGTRAGYLLVYPDHIDFRASHAPSFVDITPATDEMDIELEADGNYVRVRDMELTEPEISAMRQKLLDFGAKGVVFNVTRKGAVPRAGATIGKALTIAESVDKYIAGLKLTYAPAVQKLANDILSGVLDPAL